MSTSDSFLQVEADPAAGTNAMGEHCAPRATQERGHEGEHRPTIAYPAGEQLESLHANPYTDHLFVEEADAASGGEIAQPMEEDAGPSQPPGQVRKPARQKRQNNNPLCRKRLIPSPNAIVVAAVA